MLRVSSKMECRFESRPTRKNKMLMSNVKSNAKMLSKSALWETVFGGNPVAVRQFVFRAGIKTVGHGPTFDRCVVGYGENEQQARSNAEAVLYGKLGHNGYHLGEQIPMI